MTASRPAASCTSTTVLKAFSPSPIATSLSRSILGSDELTTIEGLYDMVEEIAGIKLKHTHNLTAPKGVNGRNSDNTKIQEYLGWAPGIRLRDGMKKTYDWIYGEYQEEVRRSACVIGHTNADEKRPGIAIPGR